MVTTVENRVNEQMIEAARGVDLVHLVETDLGPGQKSGRWVMFRCPFHEDRHPSMGVTNGDGVKPPYFQCYACGEKGSAIDWVMRIRKMDFGQAVHELSGGGFAARREMGSQARGVASSPAFHHPPGEKWQGRAWQLIERAHECLLGKTGWESGVDWQEGDAETGEMVIRRMSPMEYLLSRGLREETLRIWKIGYIPKAWKDRGELWGMSEEEIWVYQGVLIPCMIDNQVWYMKIRLPMPLKGPKDRYRHITGGESALYMVQTLDWNETAVFCEGELDALLLWQEVEGLAGVVTLGGASGGFSVADWGLYLLHTVNRLIAYDMDQAGDAGAAKLAWLGNSRRLEVPRERRHDKDITDYWRSGGDLRAWLLHEFVNTQTNAPGSSQEALRAVI